MPDVRGGKPGLAVLLNVPRSLRGVREVLRAVRERRGGGAMEASLPAPVPERERALSR